MLALLEHTTTFLELPINKHLSQCALLVSEAPIRTKKDGEAVNLAMKEKQRRVEEPVYEKIVTSTKVPVTALQKWVGLNENRLFNGLTEPASLPIPFLDCLVTRDNNQVWTTVYRKPTHTDRLLDEYPYNPTSHKATTIRTYPNETGAISL